jgi:hypothetical protein
MCPAKLTTKPVPLISIVFACFVVAVTSLGGWFNLKEGAAVMLPEDLPFKVVRVNSDAEPPMRPLSGCIHETCSNTGTAQRSSHAVTNQKRERNQSHFLQGHQGRGNRYALVGPIVRVVAARLTGSRVGPILRAPLSVLASTPSGITMAALYT